MDNSLENDCPICLVPLLTEVENEKILAKTPCNHLFHRSCLCTWSISGVLGDYCPLCKTHLMETKAVMIFGGKELSFVPSPPVTFANPGPDLEMQQRIRALIEYLKAIANEPNQEKTLPEATNPMEITPQASSESEEANLGAGVTHDMVEGNDPSNPKDESNDFLSGLTQCFFTESELW